MTREFVYIYFHEYVYMYHTVCVQTIQTHTKKNHDLYEVTFWTHAKYYLDFVYMYKITYIIDLAPLDILKIGFCFT